MNRYLNLIYGALLWAGCSTPTRNSTEADSLAIEQDTVLVEESPASESDEPIPNANLKSLPFEGIPTELQEFLLAVGDVDKLEAYYNSSVGAYIIEEGPGVYPIVTEVKSRDDFLQSSEFMLFMNTPRLTNGYFINEEDVDPCNLPDEGIFFLEATKDGHRIFDSYQSHLSAAGETMTDEMKDKLNKLDTSLIWYGSVNLPNKFDELNTFDIYLASVDGKICIAAIDSRGCGI